MKLSVSQLRRIIKEEVSRMLVMEVVYEDPYEEEEYGYSDPSLGDEPPEAKDIPDPHKQLKDFIQQYSPRDIDIPYNPEPGRDYAFDQNGKLKLKPRLYDAIDNQRGAIKKLKALFPKGVVSGL